MNGEVVETFDGKQCERCGSTTRYTSTKNCRYCNRVRNAARTWSGPIQTQLRGLLSKTDEHPFDRADRPNGNDGDGPAAYYRSAFFDRCELCARPGLVDGIVCERCAPIVNAPAPEAHFREPDLSDVARRLAELRP